MPKANTMIRSLSPAQLSEAAECYAAIERAYDRHYSSEAENMQRGADAMLSALGITDLSTYAQPRREKSCPHCQLDHSDPEP